MGGDEGVPIRRKKYAPNVASIQLGGPDSKTLKLVDIY